MSWKTNSSLLLLIFIVIIIVFIIHNIILILILFLKGTALFLVFLQEAWDTPDDAEAGGELKDAESSLSEYSHRLGGAWWQKFAEVCCCNLHTNVHLTVVFCDPALDLHLLPHNCHCCENTFCSTHHFCCLQVHKQPPACAKEHFASQGSKALLMVVSAS